MTASVIDGMLPPVGKNASRICAARWNSRSVAGESVRASALSCRQVQSRLRRVDQLRQMLLEEPVESSPGPNRRPKSASGTSCVLPRVNG